MSTATKALFPVSADLPVTQTLSVDTADLRHGDVVTRRLGTVKLQAAITGGWYVTDQDADLLATPRRMLFGAGHQWLAERPVYVVEYRATLGDGSTELVRAEHDTELDAVHLMGAVATYVNLEPVAVGRNVDPGKFRH